MQIHADILILTAVAAVIIGRLFFVLGTRNENDTPRPNPFSPPEKTAEDSGDEPFAPQERAAQNAELPAPGNPDEPPFLRPRTPPAAGSLAAGLADILAIDATFDERAFLRDAKNTFTAVVEAYASGRLEVVSDRLSGPLLAQFQQAADLRRAQGQSAVTRVRAIREAEVTAARADGTRAVITVRFISQQENIVRDQAGNVIGGIEGQSEEVTDTWTFLHDTARADTLWIVIETRG